MRCQIVFSREAEEDLERMFDFAFERELNSPTGDLEIPTKAIEAIRQGCQFLAVSPFSGQGGAKGAKKCLERGAEPEKQVAIAKEIAKFDAAQTKKCVQRHLAGKS